MSEDRKTEQRILSEQKVKAQVISVGKKIRCTLGNLYLVLKHSEPFCTMFMEDYGNGRITQSRPNDSSTEIFLTEYTSAFGRVSLSNLSQASLNTRLLGVINTLANYNGQYTFEEYRDNILDNEQSISSLISLMNDIKNFFKYRDYLQHDVKISAVILPSSTLKLLSNTSTMPINKNLFITYTKFKKPGAPNNDFLNFQPLPYSEDERRIAKENEYRIDLETREEEKKLRDLTDRNSEYSRMVRQESENDERQRIAEAERLRDEAERNGDVDTLEQIDGYLNSRRMKLGKRAGSKRVGSKRVRTSRKRTGNSRKRSLKRSRKRSSPKKYPKRSRSKSQRRTSRKTSRKRSGKRQLKRSRN